MPRDDEPESLPLVGGDETGDGDPWLAAEAGRVSTPTIDRRWRWLGLAGAAVALLLLLEALRRTFIGPASEECGWLTHHRGGLVSSPEYAHPIPRLICQAERAWRHKVARQSQTVAAAAAEYRRRHGLDPPRGFDAWFEWARDHAVVLPDEYDVLEAKLRPFRAYDGPTYRARQAALRDPLAYGREHIGHLDIRGGEVTYEATIDIYVASLARTLDPLRHLLPDSSMSIQLFDGPRQIIDRETLAKHLDAVDDGRYLSDAELQSWSRDLPFAIESACPPPADDRDTPAAPAFLGIDWAADLDVCAQRQWLELHGVTRHTLEPGWEAWCIRQRWLEPPNGTWPLCGKPPMPFAPLWNWSPMSIFSEIPLPNVSAYPTPSEHRLMIGKPNGPFDEAERIIDPFAYDDKPLDRLVWRGALSGQVNIPTSPWQDGQRARLARLAHPDHEHRLEVPRADGRTGALDWFEADAELLAQRYLDVGLTPPYTLCGDDCDAMQKFVEAHARPGMTLSRDEQWRYRYVMDVDGHGWSGRLKLLMAGNQLVFKQTWHSEWFSDSLQPWYHFVPVSMGLADLYGALAYFSGDLDGRHAHQADARRIAHQGSQWALQHSRIEDVQAYLYRAFLELARLEADDRDAMSYKG